MLPAWSTSITTRAKRRPKIVLVDTGLAANLSGLGPQAFEPTSDGVAAGALFDTFVTTEVLTARHARHLAMLPDKLGDRFRTGLVVHASISTR